MTTKKGGGGGRGSSGSGKRQPEKETESGGVCGGELDPKTKRAKQNESDYESVIDSCGMATAVSKSNVGHFTSSLPAWRRYFGDRGKSDHCEAGGGNDAGGRCGGGGGRRVGSAKHMWPSARRRVQPSSAITTNTIQSYPMSSPQRPR
jgi:hypothetical protein